MKFVAVFLLSTGCSIHHFDIAPVPYTITETVSCSNHTPSVAPAVWNGTKLIQTTTKCGAKL